MFFKIKPKKISIIVFVSLFLFLLGGKAYAGTESNAIGWLWGGSQDGSNSSYTGVGWISMNSTNTSSPINYGVTFPLDGTWASGYAWNENVGWISFNQSDLVGCPSGECSAKRDGESLKGWARIIGVCDTGNASNTYTKDGQCDSNDDGTNSGGWSGFIKLDQVTFNSSTGRLGGYAWNGENDNDPPIGYGNIANGFGWIRFSRAGIAISDPPPIFSICRDSCDSAVDVSRTGFTFSMLKGEIRNLRACYNSFGCLMTDSLTDVTGDLNTIWTEGGSNAISLSSDSPNEKASADNNGLETITASYQGNQASVKFSVSSFMGKNCWRCDSGGRKCLYEAVISGNCSGEYFDSRDDCDKICGYSPWKEVAP